MPRRWLLVVAGLGAARGVPNRLSWHEWLKLRRNIPLRDALLQAPPAGDDMPGWITGDGIRMPISSDREKFPGEIDFDEGLANQPLQRANATGIASLLERLATLSPEAGFHHKVAIDFPDRPQFGSTVRSVGFMLWLPAGFLEGAPNGSGAWPTVFSLHGRGEVTGPGNYSVLGRVVRHGLPHRLRDRVPFNRQFVVVSPIMTSTRWNISTEQLLNGINGPSWLEYLDSLEAMRIALFTHGSDWLDRERAYLTGVSIGGTGVWSWAAFNPNGVQPWAGIVPTSSAWPRAPSYNESDVPPFHVLEAPKLSRLARIPTYVAHCVNDGSIPIDLGALLRARCTLDYFGTFTNTSFRQYGPPRCEPGPDAIVEALQLLNADVTYERIPNCPMVRQPTDTSFTTMYPSDTTDLGHDSASRLYASRDFIRWLLAHRLQPEHRWW